LLRQHIAILDSSYERVDEWAVHRTARIEAGAVIKGPAIIGPNCFIAAGAYLRGGVYLEQDCIIGPSSELKTSVMFAGSKLAHMNFVGDSIIGADVNIEAGVVIANHRNEREDRNIRIVYHGQVIDTGVSKFGALVGDGSRIGANAVVAPGALLKPASIVGRLQLIDQRPEIPLT
jgi:NDP-sugar pyrophosphorylase family protein